MKAIIIILLLILFFAPITSSLLGFIVLIVARILSYGLLILIPIGIIFIIYKLIKSIKEDTKNA